MLNQSRAMFVLVLGACSGATDPGRDGALLDSSDRGVSQGPIPIPNLAPCVQSHPQHGVRRGSSDTTEYLLLRCVDPDQIGTSGTAALLGRYLAIRYNGVTYESSQVVSYNVTHHNFADTMEATTATGHHVFWRSDFQDYANGRSWVRVTNSSGAVVVPETASVEMFRQD